MGVLTELGVVPNSLGKLLCLANPSRPSVKQGFTGRDGGATGNLQFPDYSARTTLSRLNIQAIRFLGDRHEPWASCFLDHSDPVRAIHDSVPISHRLFPPVPRPPSPFQAKLYWHSANFAAETSPSKGLCSHSTCVQRASSRDTDAAGPRITNASVIHSSGYTGCHAIADAGRSAGLSACVQPTALSHEHVSQLLSISHSFGAGKDHASGESLARFGRRAARVRCTAGALETGFRLMDD